MVIFIPDIHSDLFLIAIMKKKIVKIGQRKVETEIAKIKLGHGGSCGAFSIFERLIKIRVFLQEIRYTCPIILT